MDARLARRVAAGAWADRDAGRSACVRVLPELFRAQDRDCPWASGEEVAEVSARLRVQPDAPLAVAQRQVAVDALAEAELPQDAQRAAGPERAKDVVAVAAPDALALEPPVLTVQQVSALPEQARPASRLEPLERAQVPLLVQAVPRAQA